MVSKLLNYTNWDFDKKTSWNTLHDILSGKNWLSNFDNDIDIPVKAVNTVLYHYDNSGAKNTEFEIFR